MGLHLGISNLRNGGRGRDRGSTDRPKSPRCENRGHGQSATDMPHKCCCRFKQCAAQPPLRRKLPHQQKQRNHTQVINRQAGDCTALEQIQQRLIIGHRPIASCSGDEHGGRNRDPECHQPQHPAEHPQTDRCRAHQINSSCPMSNKEACQTATSALSRSPGASDA